MLADPRLVIIEPVEVLQELEVALDRQGRVLVVIMKRRQEDAASQIGIAHIALPYRFMGAEPLLDGSSAIAPGCGKRFRAGPRIALGAAHRITGTSSQRRRSRQDPLVRMGLCPQLYKPAAG